MLHQREIFVKAIHLKCSSRIKQFPVQFCNRIKTLWGLCHFLIILILDMVISWKYELESCSHSLHISSYKITRISHLGRAISLGKGYPWISNLEKTLCWSGRTGPLTPHVLQILKEVWVLYTDWLILMSCQHIWGYFMPRGYETAYIVCLYLNFLCSFLRIRWTWYLTVQYGSSVSGPSEKYL